jgi:hypothetical protein
VSASFKFSPQSMGLKKALRIKRSALVMPSLEG